MKKMLSREWPLPGDDDKLKETVFHNRWITEDCKVSGRPRMYVSHIGILCARANPPLCLFKGGVYISLRASNKLLCGVYSMAASIRENTVYSVLMRPASTWK